MSNTPTRWHKKRIGATFRVRDENSMSIAECLDEERANQIVSEHNSHDQLVEALEDIEQNLVAASGLQHPHTKIADVAAKARQALALAGKERRLIIRPFINIG